MTYYAHINSHNILAGVDMSMLVQDEYGSDDVQNIEVSKTVYDNQDQYIYKNGKVVKNPNYNKEQLEKAKSEKYKEANDKANEFLDKVALFELSEDYHVEATKENMNTFATAAIGIERELIPYQEWTSKEDNVRQLNLEQCLTISMGIGAIQSSVWNVQFIAYKTAIENAETIAEVERININYD